MRTLKKIAAAGRTVALTVHQPNSDITELFDDFILMAKGQIMYAGAATCQSTELGHLACKARSACMRSLPALLVSKHRVLAPCTVRPASYVCRPLGRRGAALCGGGLPVPAI